MNENDEIRPGMNPEPGEEQQNLFHNGQMPDAEEPAELPSEGTTSEAEQKVEQTETGAEPPAESAAPESPQEGKEDGKPEEKPLIVDMSGITYGTQEVEDLSKFQHIVDGFFAQTKEPALTISGKTVTVNAAAVRLFPAVDFMEILINEEDRKVAFEPCSELNIWGYKWAREKDGKRYATTRTGLPFVLCICQIMGWDPNKRYKIRGKKVLDKKGKEILVFDLKAYQGFEKPAPGEKGKTRSTILTGWNGVFGPKYNESESTIHVETFDKYSFFSIKEGWVQGNVGQGNDGKANHDQGGDAQNEAENEE